MKNKRNNVEACILLGSKRYFGWRKFKVLAVKKLAESFNALDTVKSLQHCMDWIWHGEEKKIEKGVLYVHCSSVLIVLILVVVVHNVDDFDFWNGFEIHGRGQNIVMTFQIFLGSIFGNPSFYIAKWFLRDPITLERWSKYCWLAPVKQALYITLVFLFHKIATLLYMHLL